MSGFFERGNAHGKKILIVDDEASIRRILETRFKMLGYDTAVAGDGEEALQVYAQFQPDIIVLDIMMPKVDGYAVTREIRLQSDVPIIILTALGDVNERVSGLEMGADDYVIKPFSPKELEARVKSVLRRVETRRNSQTLQEGVPVEQGTGHAIEVALETTPAARTSFEASELSADMAGGTAASIASPKRSSHMITVGHLRIDTQKRQVFRKNERIRLTGMEFNLLELLLSNAGQPFTRAAILQHVWSFPPDQKIDTRVVDVHVSRLRAKLETDLANPELILTARGVGYMFQRLDIQS
ncbi:MAG: response regulator transcription factor [Vampirovibrionales bacterium]